MAAEYETVPGQYGTLKVPLFGSAYERRLEEERKRAAQSPLEATAQSRLVASLPPYLATIAATNPLKATNMFKAIYPGQALGSVGATAGTATGGTAVPVTPGPTGVPDILSGGGYNPLASGPAWAPGGGGPANQALDVISGLLNRNPDTSEWDTESASRAVRLGIPGSATAMAEGSRLRQSEIDKRNKLGLDALDPYLQRQQSTFELIEKGRQAKDLLRMEQAGQIEKLTLEQKARLEEIAAQGEITLANTRLGGEFGLAGNRITAGASMANAATGAEARRYEADSRNPPLNPIVAKAIANAQNHRTLTGARTGGGLGYVPPPGYDDSGYPIGFSFGPNRYGTGSYGNTDPYDSPDTDYLSQFDDEFDF